jgi:predicted peptidase
LVAGANDNPLRSLSAGAGHCKGVFLLQRAALAEIMAHDSGNVATFSWGLSAMRYVRFGTTVLALGLAAVAAPANRAGDKTDDKPGVQVAKEFTMDKLKIGYLLFLPQDYGKSDKKLPLILFLHGAGESDKSGKDLDKVKKHGPPKIVESKKDFPFIVVSPQSPGGGWNVEGLNALLGDILAKYRADPDRVYLTGLSMGGGGTWNLAAAHPERFAAIVPICGAVKQFNDPDKLKEFAGKLKNLPTWVFHGAKDTSVPLARSEMMVKAIKEAGGDPKFTIYPNAGHDSWTEAYNTPELYTWLLEQKRPAQK